MRPFSCKITVCVRACACRLSIDVSMLTILVAANQISGTGTCNTTNYRALTALCYAAHNGTRCGANGSAFGLTAPMVTVMSSRFGR